MNGRVRAVSKEVLERRLTELGDLNNDHEQTIIDALNASTPREAVKVLLDYAITQPQILVGLNGYQPRKEIAA